MIRTKTVPIFQSKELSLKIAGAQRDYTTAYNIGIAESYAALERRTPQYLFDLHKRLTVWRKNSDMSSGNVLIQRAAVTQARESVIRFDRANRRKRSKARTRWTDPLTLFKTGHPTITAFVRSTVHEDNTMHLSGIGRVRAKISIRGWDVRSWQLVRTTKRLTRRTRPDQHTYELHVQVRLPDPEPVGKGDTVGLDVGTVHPATSYNADTGETIMHDPPPDARRRRDDQISGMQARQSAFRRNSRRWKHAKRLVRHARRKLSNRQDEFERKTAIAIADGAREVCMEDLHVGAMTARKRGAGRGLNREMRYARLGSLMGRIRQTCSNRGIRVTLVSPRYTSQTCAECGHIDKNSRRSQSEFICTGCGHEANADANAARNMAARSTAGNAAKAAGNAVSRQEDTEKVYAPPSSDSEVSAGLPEKGGVLPYIIPLSFYRHGTQYGREVLRCGPCRADLLVLQEGKARGVYGGDCRGRQVRRAA